jgi:hypothetical protein
VNAASLHTILVNPNRAFDVFSHVPIPQLPEYQ